MYVTKGAEPYLVINKVYLLKKIKNRRFNEK